MIDRNHYISTSLSLCGLNLSSKAHVGHFISNKILLRGRTQCEGFWLREFHVHGWINVKCMGFEAAGSGICLLSPFGFFHVVMRQEDACLLEFLQ